MDISSTGRRRCYTSFLFSYICLQFSPVVAKSSVSKTIAYPSPLEWNSTNSFLGIPHVDSCHTCHSCFVLPPTAVYSRQLLSAKPPIDIKLGHTARKEKFPNCAACWGCLHQLRRLPQTRHAFNLSEGFLVARGQTSAHIYEIEDPNLSKEGQFVVKIWGINLKRSSFLQQKKKKKILALGIQRIVDECEFRAIVSNVWLGPVDGVIPNYGMRVKWDGLWSNLARGVSVSSFEDDAIDNGMDPSTFEDFLNNKLNSTEIVMAAIFDLLTCQGDRHGQNIFIDETGHITLIDNNEAFGYGWREVGVDSLFLPSTQYHTAQHVGQTYLWKKSDTPREHPVSLVLYDYRCHTPDGKIGFNYPSAVVRTLNQISNMSVEHVTNHYYLPSKKASKKLIQRAKDMLTMGFEWTLENGWPHNPRSLKYPWHPPCCKVRLDPDSSSIECSVEGYERNFYRPEDDAIFGKH